MIEHPIVMPSWEVRATLEGRKWQTRRLVDVKRLRIRLPRAVSSDLPVCIRARPIIAKPAIYPAGMNPQGAMSVRVNGELLGVKPGEFDFVCPFLGAGVTRLEPHTSDGTWHTYPTGGEARLWVRETWAPADCMYQSHEIDPARVVAYKADGTALDHVSVPPKSPPRWDLASWDFGSFTWRSSILMPRWASRLQLNVSRVRLEQLQALTTADAIAEGMQLHHHTSKYWRGSPHRVKGTPKCMVSAIDAYRDHWNYQHGKQHGKRMPWESNPWVWVIEYTRVEPRFAS